MKIEKNTFANAIKDIEQLALNAFCLVMMVTTIWSIAITPSMPATINGVIDPIAFILGSTTLIVTGVALLLDYFIN